MKYEARAKLLRDAEDSIEMQERAGITPMCKMNDGELQIASRAFCGKYDYEFPLAVVEGEPVFVGDKLYDTLTGSSFTAERVSTDHPGHRQGVACFYMATRGCITYVDKASWNPPKPKTVMVELTREDAEYLARLMRMDVVYGVRDINRACRKALGE
jgi:hypothetical protein